MGCKTALEIGIIVKIDVDAMVHKAEWTEGGHVYRSVKFLWTTEFLDNLLNEAEQQVRILQQERLSLKKLIAENQSAVQPEKKAVITPDKKQPALPEKKGIKPNAGKSESTYTVKKGDTAFSIAKRNNITLDQLSEWNSIGPGGVKTGQVLRIK